MMNHWRIEAVATRSCVRSEVGNNLLPRCHRVVSLLKRWLLGTHQGGISHEHLTYYLVSLRFGLIAGPLIIEVN